MSTQRLLFDLETRQRWPRPLAVEWQAAYSQLFDDDDLRLACAQPGNHFCEWLVAIHLFETEGWYALVEKYGYRNHRRKHAQLDELLTPEHASFIRRFRTVFGVQPPDLLVYTPDRSQFWFAEVKGPGDRLSPLQVASHSAITSRLHVPVETYLVRQRME